VEVGKRLAEHLRAQNGDEARVKEGERRNKGKEKVGNDDSWSDDEATMMKGDVQPMMLEEEEESRAMGVMEPMTEQNGVQQSSFSQRGVLVLYLSVRKKRLFLQQLIDEGVDKVQKATRKWQHLVRLRPRKRKSEWKARAKVKRQRPGPMLKTSYDIYQQTGLVAEEFFKVFDLVKADLRRPRTGKKTRRGANQLVDKARVALILTFFRKGQDYNIAGEWGISQSYLTREVRFLVPILAYRLSFITIPKEWPIYTFEKVIGAIDCSPHFRNRVHPHNHDYYRGDKKGHFLSAQLVCGLSGKIYDVAIFPGRVNDQMAFTLTWQDLLDREGILLLADGGYYDIHLITPTTTQDREWNNAQKSYRSVIEHVNSIVSNFRYASTRVRGHTHPNSKPIA
jgi:hypothetical protein